MSQTIKDCSWVIQDLFQLLVQENKALQDRKIARISKSIQMPHSIYGFHLNACSGRGGHRSFRGSVKIKQTYEHLKENGDLGAMNRTSTSRRTPDIDIKLLQAKRQQAEMRR